MQSSVNLPHGLMTAALLKAINDISPKSSTSMNDTYHSNNISICNNEGYSGLKLQQQSLTECDKQHSEHRQSTDPNLNLGNLTAKDSSSQEEQKEERKEIEFTAERLQNNDDSSASLAFQQLPLTKRIQQLKQMARKVKTLKSQIRELRNRRKVFKEKAKSSLRKASIPTLDRMIAQRNNQHDRSKLQNHDLQQNINIKGCNQYKQNLQQPKLPRTSMRSISKSFISQHNLKIRLNLGLLRNHLRRSSFVPQNNNQYNPFYQTSLLSNCNQIGNPLHLAKNEINVQSPFALVNPSTPIELKYQSNEQRSTFPNLSHTQGETQMLPYMFKEAASPQNQNFFRPQLLYTQYQYGNQYPIVQ